MTATLRCHGGSRSDFNVAIPFPVFETEIHAADFDLASISYSADQNRFCGCAIWHKTNVCERIHAHMNRRDLSRGYHAGRSTIRLAGLLLVRFHCCESKPPSQH